MDIIKLVTDLNVSLSLRVMPQDRDNFWCDKIYICVKHGDVVREFRWRMIYMVLLLFSYEVWLSLSVCWMLSQIDSYLSVCLIASTMLIVGYAVFKGLCLGAETGGLLWKNHCYTHIGLNTVMLLIDMASTTTLIYTSIGHAGMLVYFNYSIGSILTLLKCSFRIYMIVKYWKGREQNFHGEWKCVMEAIEVASIKNIFCECETRPLSDCTLISGKTRLVHHDYTTIASTDVSHSESSTQFVCGHT